MVRVVTLSPKVIEENINNVMEGKALTIPLRVLRLYGNFKEVIMEKRRFVKYG